MVNTMVKDPKRRNVNRKIDRYKKRRMHHMIKHIAEPSDASSLESIANYSRKISELKRLKEQDKSSSKKSEEQGKVNTQEH